MASNNATGQYQFNCFAGPAQQEIDISAVIADGPPITISSALSLPTIPFTNPTEVINYDDPQHRAKIAKKYCQEVLHVGDHTENIEKLKSISAVISYCTDSVNHIDDTDRGDYIEAYIIKKYRLTKHNSGNKNGDCSTSFGWNIEIKTGFNMPDCAKNENTIMFSGLKLSHNCHSYVLVAYNLNSENMNTGGEIYIFNVPKADMLLFVQSINSKTLNFTIGNQRWNELLKYRIRPYNLYSPHLFSEYAYDIFSFGFDDDDEPIVMPNISKFQCDDYI